ncbi:hypothetical protein EGR_08686 [Echinococcus granulosus]|uniref:Uncharacterized protein n=1 Tax=Echinococcus granulosus TaxID=6210 RepID=W6USV0_ECHGR|nr:hypothetical protein EGR_08686 [Echinococcus granulosus]EUB56464.1 hypothetical protein EGR_08686 [Echinococcus granulosus]
MLTWKNSFKHISNRRNDGKRPFGLILRTAFNDGRVSMDLSTSLGQNRLSFIVKRVILAVNSAWCKFDCFLANNDHFHIILLSLMPVPVIFEGSLSGSQSPLMWVVVGGTLREKISTRRLFFRLGFQSFAKMWACYATRNQIVFKHKRNGQFVSLNFKWNNNLTSFSGVLVLLVYKVFDNYFWMCIYKSHERGQRLPFGCLIFVKDLEFARF